MMGIEACPKHPQSSSPWGSAIYNAHICKDCQKLVIEAIGRQYFGHSIVGLYLKAFNAIARNALEVKDLNERRNKLKALRRAYKKIGALILDGKHLKLTR